MLRALVYTLAAQTALLKVNISQVVLKGDGLELACLYALAASYATHLTCLLGHWTFVLVYATYINPTVQLVLVTQLNNHARASLGTGSASRTRVLIHNRKTGLGIHMNSIELARLDAVTASQTSKETTGSTAVHQSSGSTTGCSVINTQTGTVCT